MSSNNWSSGSNYNYSGTSSGQGNWNTGGQPTGHGSFANGIVGNQPRYNVAPTIGRMDPAHFAQVMARWQAATAPRGPAPRDALRPQQAQPPVPMPVAAPPVPQIPIPQANPFKWMERFGAQPAPLPGRGQPGWSGYVPGTQQADPTAYPGSNTSYPTYNPNSPVSPGMGPSAPRMGYGSVGLGRY